MNYIISPFAIYFIFNMNILKRLLTVMVIISAIAVIFYFVGWCLMSCNKQFGEADSDYIKSACDYIINAINSVK